VVRDGCTCGGVGGGVVDRVWRRGETSMSNTAASKDITPLSVWECVGSERPGRRFWKTPAFHGGAQYLYN